MRPRDSIDTPATPLNSEANVLGSILLERETIERVKPILPDAMYFYKTEHRILYEQMLSFDEVADGWDAALVLGWLKEHQLAEAVGGSAYLMTLLNTPVHTIDAEHHARKIVAGFTNRQAANIAHNLVKRIQAGCAIETTLGEAVNDLKEVAAECEPTGTAAKLAIRTADSVVEEPLNWLWPNRIPAGMYSFIVGDPGVGKSFLSCYIASIASTGGLWADGTWVGEPMEVLMFVAEDHLAKTLVPRLNAHCADLSRVHICQGIAATGGDSGFVIQQNLSAVEAFLEANTDCRLIMLDPVTAFMGSANQNSQADVRDVLGRISRLAETRNVTIIGLSHLNKKVDLDMRHRSVGSVAFNAVPRAVWGVCAMDEGELTNDDVRLTNEKEPNRLSSIDNPQSPRRRFLFPIKDNLCVAPTAMDFTIDAGRIHFGEALTQAELNNVLNPSKPDKPRHVTKKEKAKQLILQKLTEDPCPSQMLIDHVTAEGIGEKTVLNARQELRNAKIIDCHNPDSNGYLWFILEHL